MVRDPSSDAWSTIPTREPAESVERAAVTLEMTLTVAAHTRLDRVGERARIDAQGAKGQAVSRTEPAFAPVGGGAPRPLKDPFVSREPVWIRRVGERVRIARPSGGTKLAVDGEPVDSSIEVPESALDRGVVIELADRVVLVLAHHPSRPREEGYGLVGISAAIERVRAEIRRVAASDAPTLIRGETGTGKELVSRSIHEASHRATGPFVAINMAAIPASTAVAQLFGHRKGAFTGADTSHDGYFGQADGGTLFLDEIGEMSVDLQTMLLRVLDRGEIQPIGARGTQSVDVRVIAATDAELSAAVSERRFRAPLLHRVSGYPLTVPPLRARREDIAVLLLHFLRGELERIGERDRLEAPSGDKPWLSPRLLARLVLHPWPGNVRELRNVAGRLVIAGREHDSLGAEFADRLIDTPRSSAPAPTAAPPGVRAALDQETVLAALEAAGFSVTSAARRLRVSRAALYRFIKDSDLIRTANDLTADEIRAADAACAGDLTAMSRQLRVSKRALKLRISELKL